MVVTHAVARAAQLGRELGCDQIRGVAVVDRRRRVWPDPADLPRTMAANREFNNEIISSSRACPGLIPNLGFHLCVEYYTSRPLSSPVSRNCEQYSLFIPCECRGGWRS